MSIRSTLAVLVAAAGLGWLPAGAGSPEPTLEQAGLAWERGDYVPALETYLGVLDSPAAAAARQAIALQTGELYITTELIRDGASPAIAPDGSTVAYETGSGLARTTRLQRVPAGPSPSVTLHGFGAVFSTDGSSLAYLAVDPSPALAAADAAVAAPAPQDRARLQTAFDKRVAVEARIVVRDLASSRERDIPAPEFSKTQLTFIGGTVWFAGRSSADAVRQVYQPGPDAPPAARTTGPGDKSIIRTSPAGTALCFSIAPPAGTSRTASPPAFGVLSAAGRLTMVTGSAPAFSGDGAALAYVAPGSGGDRLMVAPTAAPETAVVVRTAPRLDAPALSADGGRLAFQMMVKDDWEIYTIDRSGANERRVTHEIQHDVLPAFLGPDRLLAKVGEPRHRRAYLYDLADGTRTRLFHNNTVRTIAPEYGWIADAGGTRIVVTADRDGDTVSPERGIYLVDLTRQVTIADLRARVAADLAAERALRALGVRLFAPIAQEVAAVTSGASVERIYASEKALAGFDSKYITEPGNARAAAFLADAYRSFGYQPRSEAADFRLRDGRTARSANVIAELRGTTSPDLIYVVSSHYDSALAGPGADDNTSGTAALLESARLLAGRPQAATILFASFTGEEAGLLGSREFVRRAAAAGLRIVGALNNDTVGWSNDERLDDTIRYSNAGIRDLQHAAAMQFSRLITYDSRYFKNTDAAAYYEAFGDIVGGLGSYPVLGSPHYHQAHDLLETVNHQLVTEVARTTVASVMLMASSPAPVRGLVVDEVRDGKARLSWLPSPEHDVTGYMVDTGTARLRVSQPAAAISAPAPGTRITVRAVNRRGLESWDTASVIVN